MEAETTELTPFVLMFLGACIGFISCIFMEYLIEMEILQKVTNICKSFLHACKWCVDPLVRAEVRNARYQRRIKRIEGRANRREERQRKAKRLEEEYAELQQKMVDTCYEHPEEWNDLEGKR